MDGTAELLTRLRKALAEGGIELADEELVDVLRLAVSLQGHSAPLLRARQGGSGEDVGQPDRDHHVHAPGRDATRIYASTGTSPESRTPGRGGAGEPGDEVMATSPIRLPGAKALPDRLALGRTLRPFKHRVASRVRSELDISATVDATAESGFLTPLTRPAKERWLRLALVLDGTVGSLLWHRLALEFRELLTTSGAFAQVSTHLLDRGRWVVRRPWGRSRFPGAAPESLADPSGRTCILLLTDGSTDWYGADLEELLAFWSSRSPTALLHVLPRSMWRRTGVNAETWQASSPRPGAANASWTVTHPLLPSEAAPRPHLSIPVLELSAASLTAWASLTTSSGRTVPLPLWSRTDLAPQQGRTVRPTVAEFRRRSSPAAYRLAAYLALFAPMSVPVMHLVHACVDEAQASGTSALAEVVLSGLLEFDESTGELGFAAETRAGLLSEAMPNAELAAFRRRVARLIESSQGRAPIALLSREVAASRGATGRGSGAHLATVRAPAPTPDTGERPPGGGQRPDHLAQAPGSPPWGRAPEPSAPTHRSKRWPEDTPRPLFFLSYANPERGRVAQQRSSVGPERWETMFFEDLCEAVVDLAGLRVGEPAGFMLHRSLRPGEDWSARVSEAVAHAQVFVPLYSPRYFRTEHCGQEWAAFARRRVLPVNRTSTQATGIVPVRWVTVSAERLPPAAAGLQFDDPDLGAEYRDMGLLALGKISRFRADYEYAVHRLAQRIVQVSEQTIIPVGEYRDIQEFPNAFGTQVPQRQLHIWPAALSADRLPVGRSADRYGLRPGDWRPYGGVAADTAANRAGLLAREMQRQPQVGDFATEARELLETGVVKAPTLLLLDRWALLDSEHRELLRRIDDLNPSAVSLVQPWSREDPESTARESELAALAARTMPHFHARPWGSGVAAGPDAYAEVLPEAVRAAVRGFERTAGSGDVAGSPDPAPRPRLRDIVQEGQGQGPGTADGGTRGD